MKIYLARHGQDEDNANGILNGWRDTSLTPLGLEQAQRLAAHIKESHLTLDKTYSSPLSRAYKTAETITDVLYIEKPLIIEGLKERDFGVMTGKPAKDIEKTCAPDIIKTSEIVYFLSPEGAETFPELIKRGRKVIKEIKNRHTEGNILLVTHGDIGKMIYAAYYNLDWKRVLTMFHFGNSELLLLAEDSSSEDTHVFRVKKSDNIGL